MDERILEDIVSGIDDKYINETASALYENESRNVTNSDDLIIVENRIKKFPFALVTAAVVVIAIVSVMAGVVLFNNQNINTLDSSQKQEYPLFHEDMLAVEKDGKWGYINKQGEWVIEPQFDEACAFQKNGYAIVGIEAKDDKGSETMIYGLIDKSGNYVIEPRFDWLYPFDDNGFALINKYGSAWYIDISDNVLTKPGFTSSKTTRFWSNDYAVVGDQIYGGIKVGVIDSEGKYIIGPQYNNVFILENGCFMVENKDVTEGSDTVATERRYGIVDKDNNVILPVEYYSILCGDDGIYAVEHYGEAYHVDKNGNPLYKQRFDYVSIFNEYGVAVTCTKDNTYGLIDKNGNYITEPVYDYILNWGSFGTYVVEKDGKYGFINYKNEKITDIIFEHAETFKENGLAIVVKDGKYGCINKDGEFAVQPVYLSISSFTDGVAVAQTKDGFILINEKGEQITNKTYSYLGNIRNERLAFYDGKRTFGYLDYNGNVIFSQTFGEDANLWVNSYSDDGYTVVYTLDGEGKIKGSGVIDHEGNFISDLCFGKYYAYEYVEEIIGDREPDIIIKIPEDEESDNIPISFPSSPVNNNIYAHYVITENMAITAENVDTWLPYSYETHYDATDWYVVKDETGHAILKSGKRPASAIDGDAYRTNVLIGDDSLKNYSLEIKFRFAEGDQLYFSIYDSSLKESDTKPDISKMSDICFTLTADGELVKTIPEYNAHFPLASIGKINRDSWHILKITNISGRLHLEFDGEHKGSIYTVSDNEYGCFGFGGYNGIEIERITFLGSDNEAGDTDNNSAIRFPSSPAKDLFNDFIETEGLTLNASNIDKWLPCVYVNDPNAPDWYISKNEEGQPILKSGSLSIPAAPGASSGTHIHIGNDKLKNYSIEIKFRFGEGENIRFSLYESTFKGTIHPDYNVTDKDGTGTPTWFSLSANGKLYKESTFNYNELLLDLGELDKNSWYTMLIVNNSGSLQLYFNDESKGEIYKVSDNEYGSFGVGGYNIEIESIGLNDFMLNEDTETPFTENSTPENESDTPEEILPDTPVQFPSSPVYNETSAVHALTYGTLISTSNISKWLPYTFIDRDSPEWYTAISDDGTPVLKCGNISAPVPPGTMPDPHIHIGDTSLKNYSVEIKFRFAESENLYFSLYENSLLEIAPSDNASDDIGAKMWFDLSADGRLYKRSSIFYMDGHSDRMLFDFDELDRNSWHTLRIENTDGKLELIMDGVRKGELYSITDNEYGTLGIGAYGGLEIESIQIYNIITSVSS